MRGRGRSRGPGWPIPASLQARADPVAVAPAGSVTDVPRALSGLPDPGSPNERRLSVATNAAATAMFGVGTGEGTITATQAAAARAVAERVLAHADEWDRLSRNETGRCPVCGAEA